MPDMSTMDWNQRYVTKETPWDSGMASRELAHILEERKIPAGRALELGCGTGTNAIYLASRDFEVTAYDISPVAIEHAQAKARAAGANIAFSVGNVCDLPAPATKFDFAFDRGVYHSVRPNGLPGFLRTLERSLKPGGLYLTLAGNANEPSPPDQGPPRVTAEELVTELDGLIEIIQLREFRFSGVVIQGQNFAPLGWSMLGRRRAK